MDETYSPAGSPEQEALGAIIGGGLLTDLSESVRAAINTMLPPAASPAAHLAASSPHLTDLSNGERLAAAHRDRIRFCTTSKKWYVYHRTNWIVDQSFAVERMAMEVVRGMYAEASAIRNDDERKRLIDHARRTENRGRLKAMIETAAWTSGVAVTTEAFDREPMLLNVQNGTIDLRTGKLRPHRAEDLITMLAPVEYDPNAKRPVFDRFINEIMGGDAERIEHLQRLCGYAIAGDPSEQIVPFWTGSGGNGKTTLLEMIGDVLDDYAAKTPADTLVARPGRAASNDLARLRTSRFVRAAETDMDDRLAEGLVKEIAGGERMTVRFLYQDFFEFEPQFVLFLATNHRPKIAGTDEGIWRRIHLVPFDVTIPLERQDPNLRAKLRREMPGILAWLVEGCLEWQRTGLRPPDSIRDATKEYRRESDVIGHFINECCSEEDDATVAAGALHSAYITWAKETGEDVVSAKRLSKLLEERGYGKKRVSGGRLWCGLALRPASVMPGCSIMPDLSKN